MNEKLFKKLKKLPHDTGVYLFKNSKNRVIYVGKARDLKKRVSWYFTKGSHLNPKTKVLINQTNDFDVLKTDSELEALILEANLIKEYRPRYNVSLLDDKNYPFLKISTEEKFPSAAISRRRTNSGLYFGPFSGGGRVRLALKTLRDIFPLRICKTFKKRENPCLEYQIKKCSGPCAGKITLEDYQRLVQEAVLFLKGDHKNLLLDIEKQMKEEASRHNFEKAARLRDRINHLKTILENQKAVLPFSFNIDVVVLENYFDKIIGEVVYIRSGRWVNQHPVILKNPSDIEVSDFLNNFLAQFYLNSNFFPDLILTNVNIKEKKLLQDLLFKLKGNKIEIKNPKSGIFRQIIELSLKNLNFIIENSEEKKFLKGIKEKLNLKNLPEIIFGFDVSNFGSSEIVGSMVVFKNGIEVKNEYRKFIIKGFSGKPDDPRAIAEIVKRGLELRMKEKKFLPDLILIDGGITQLNSTLNSLKELKLQNKKPDVISLAKKEEKIFFENGRTLKLEESNFILKLLKRIRDEAHRFAITFHRLRLRKKLEKKI